jgi:hypothetical protein
MASHLRVVHQVQMLFNNSVGEHLRRSQWVRTEASRGSPRWAGGDGEACEAAGWSLPLFDIADWCCGDEAASC